VLVQVLKFMVSSDGGVCGLDSILFRYEAPALADASGEATRRGGER
jgi:hypothetical protein